MKVEFDDEDDEAWRQMRYWLSKYIVQQTDRHFIRYVMPKKIKKVSKKQTSKKTRSKVQKINTKTLKKAKK